MGKTNNIQKIEITTNNIVKIGSVLLDNEAIALIDDLQTEGGDIYCKSLTRLRDLIIDNCDDMSVEYDEAMHLLQMLSNLRWAIRTLKYPRDPLATKTGFDMILEQQGVKNAPEDTAAMDFAQCADSSDNAVSDDDGFSDSNYSNS